jgi:GAF domain-containing protein
LGDAKVNSATRPADPSSHHPAPNATSPPEAAATGGLDETCREVARFFEVQPHEVAVLRVCGGCLRFVYPPSLEKVGSIPLSNSTSIAVRTVAHRRPELFNNFGSVRHARVFETVPLGATRADAIEKLMSVPLVRGPEVIGVLQVCRKTRTPGPDFTREDLHRLMHVARSVALALHAQP